MKYILSILAVLAVSFTAIAQEYKFRVPTAPEQVRLAGLNYYPTEDNFAVWQQVEVAAGSSTNAVFGVSQNLFLRSNDVCTASVVLPNPTNHQGGVVRVLTTFRTAAILTNGGVGFAIASTTNTTSGAGWLARTNQLITCINPYGTNWTAIVIAP